MTELRLLHLRPILLFALGWSDTGDPAVSAVLDHQIGGVAKRGRVGFCPTGRGPLGGRCGPARPLPPTARQVGDRTAFGRATTPAHQIQWSGSRQFRHLNACLPSSEAGDPVKAGRQLMVEPGGSVAPPEALLSSKRSRGPRGQPGVISLEGHVTSRVTNGGGKTSRRLSRGQLRRSSLRRLADRDLDVRLESRNPILDLLRVGLAELPVSLLTLKPI